MPVHVLPKVCVGSRFTNDGTPSVSYEEKKPPTFPAKYDDHHVLTNYSDCMASRQAGKLPNSSDAVRSAAFRDKTPNACASGLHTPATLLASLPLLYAQGPAY